MPRFIADLLNLCCRWLYVYSHYLVHRKTKQNKNIVFVRTFDPLVNDDDVCRNYLAVEQNTVGKKSFCLFKVHFYTQCSRQNVFFLRTCPLPIKWACSVVKILGKAKNVWWDKKGFLILWLNWKWQKYAIWPWNVLLTSEMGKFSTVSLTPSGNVYFLAIVRWKHFHKAFFAMLVFAIIEEILSDLLPLKLIYCETSLPK